MALINPPAWLQQGSYPAKTDRQVIESIIPVEGVVSGLAVTQTTTASMSVNISAGKGFVAGTSVALQGMYNVINDAPSSIALPGSNVTNPRYDLIVISINDADVAGSTNSAEFKVISGVPSSSPAVPSIPPSTLVLARIYVGAGVSTITSASITDVRIRTAAKGGIITVPDSAARLRITAPSSGDPLFVNEESTGVTWRLRGTSWTPVTGETYVCTSTTRPTGIPQGFKIWETDTRQERIYSGTQWIWNGGVRPNAKLSRRGGAQTGITTTAFTVKLDTADYSNGGTIAVPDSSPVGSVTDHWIQVGEDGWYDVTFGMYVTGGASPVTVNMYLRKRNAQNATIQDYDVSSVVKTVNIDEKRIVVARLPFNKGERAHLFVTRGAGDVNTAIYGASSVYGSTSLELTYVSAF